MFPFKSAKFHPEMCSLPNIYSTNLYYPKHLTKILLFKIFPFQILLFKISDHQNYSICTLQNLWSQQSALRNVSSPKFLAWNMKYLKLSPPSIFMIVLLWRWVWPVELSCAHSLPVNTVGSSVADHHNVEVNSDLQCYSCADPDSGTKQILNRI